MTMSKRGVLRFCRTVGIMHVLRQVRRTDVRVLALHGVDDELGPDVNFDGFQVASARFREQLRAIRYGYRVARLADVVDCLVQGAPLPKNSVVLTFDDGYRNNLTHAAPILREFGMHATFFVTTGFIDGTSTPWWYRLRQLISRISAVALPTGERGPLSSVDARRQAILAWEEHLKTRPAAERDRLLADLLDRAGLPDLPDPVPMMTWDGVRTLLDMGFDVGPHTATHISLGRETADIVEREIRHSTERFEQMTGVRPSLYSYPYGSAADLSGRVFPVLESLEYKGAVTTTEGMVNADSNPLALPRLNVTGHHDTLALQSLVSGLTGFLRRTQSWTKHRTNRPRHPLSSTSCTT